MTKFTFSLYNERKKKYEEVIRAHYADTPTQELADRLGIKYWTVSKMAKRLGVSKSAAFLSSCSSRVKKRRNKKIDSKDIIEYMRQHYPTTPDYKIAEDVGINERTVRRIAAREGLHKDKDYLMRSYTLRKIGKSMLLDQEKEYLVRRIAEVFPTASKQELQALSDELEVSVKTIKSIAYKNGIHRDKEIVKKIRNETLTKYGPEFIAEFSKFFINHTNEECAQKFGAPKGSLQVLASRHGIRKSKEHISMVRSRIRQKRIKHDEK